MPDPPYGQLRIWEESRSAVIHPSLPPSPESTLPRDSSLTDLACALAKQEILRSPAHGRDPVEPLTLQWYLDLEEARHHRQGRWLASLLEFTKHAGERLLGLGVGLGSDLVRYARHGAEVFTACPSVEQLALVRRNFELRGLRAVFLHATPTSLPLESSSIDVVSLTGILHELPDPTPVLDEVYRVLKPGGKVLAVVPARYDIDLWSRWCFLGQRFSLRGDPAEPEAGLPSGLLSPTAKRFHGRELKQLFHRFHEPRVCKRHLRRAEVPHLWRWLPLGLLERMMGRLLVFKGFKPVSAAIGEQAAA
jgi:SAM-dependent methyltransferase